MFLNFLNMRLDSSPLLAGVLLAGCTLGPKMGGDTDSSPSPDTGSESTDGGGTAPGTSQGPGSDPSVPTSPTTAISSQTEPADTGVDPSFTDTDLTGGSFTDTDPTEDPDGFDTDGDDCNADTWVGVSPDEPTFHEMLDVWDQDGFGPLDCPWDNTQCVDDAPIDGLVSALVVRNDALPVKRGWLPDSARWFVWSNVALDCADPLGAPLCEGEWRVSFAISSGAWCHDFHEQGWGTGYGVENGSPFILEDGDADCTTSAFTIAAGNGNLADVAILPGGQIGYFDPMPGRVCSPCQLPGGPDLITGTYSATVCPE